MNINEVDFELLELANKRISNLSSERTIRLSFTMDYKDESYRVTTKRDEEAKSMYIDEIIKIDDSNEE
jgi:hypothetical protein